MKYTKKVRNWQIHHLSFTYKQIETVYPGLELKPMVFTGTIVEDKTNKLNVGDHTRSSLIRKIDRKNGYIITKNTVYKVEKEGGDIFEDMGNEVLKIFY